MRPRLWRLWTASQVISLCSQRWELLTEVKEFWQICFAPASSSLWVYPWNVQLRGFPDIFTAEACSQPCPDHGGKPTIPSLLLASSCPRLPSWLLSVSECLLSIQKIGEAEVKSFCLFMWQLAQSPCWQNVLGLSESHLEMALSVWNGLETSDFPRSQSAESACVSRRRPGQFKYKGGFYIFVSFSFRGMQNFYGRNLDLTVEK